MTPEKRQNDPRRADKYPPHYQERVHDDLLRAGFSPDAAAGLMSLDLDLFNHMRRVMKGDLPMTIMRELDAGLEATQFHALTAITRIQCGIGRKDPTEATVGLLAEELNVDPSRASRIVADLVDRGYMARGISQEDGRRSILTLTDSAKTLFEAFRDCKWQKTMALFKDWPEADIQEFARLFGRYTDAMRTTYTPRD